MRRYLNTATAEYYQRRGIPYRRGYLLHGPPGTGKTSLSLALAGVFKLDLYVLNMPNVSSDSALSSMFNALPARCIVLLEDIDAVGVKRQGVAQQRSSDQSSSDQSDSDDYGFSSLAPAWGHPSGPDAHRRVSKASCSLSGLLNVLDGVASQEGRIVLMTSNDPESLDVALLRPGRVDRRYHLGYMDRSAAAAMFRCMFEPEPPLVSGKLDGSDDDRGPARQEPGKALADSSGTDESVVADGVPDGCQAGEAADGSHTEAMRATLDKQAREFAALVPEGRYTPAKMQGYLLMHRESPSDAIAGLPAWIEAETREARRAEKKAAAAARASRTSQGASAAGRTEVKEEKTAGSMPKVNGVHKVEDVMVNGTT
ncbi:P-loop containing nucleoside triphosphate hydrolase protein [Microdochium bolleyi]|uniref:p-loop containing nucleoside triphosphate hydrolase protein n=1 Tax=Microdochium bolleyi TaxID=196109 RepID=A0A136J7V8_9PEZI|nr:P-loop containing nucleoside triphosphate hydrolase protein [Microdochium bolleyi]